MSAIEDLEQYIEEEGIVGISGGIFKDHENPNGGKYKTNSTLKEYCEMKGKMHNTTGEKYAAELLHIMNAPRKRIVGECSSCYVFILEGEEHKCAPIEPSNQKIIDSYFISND